MNKMFVECDFQIVDRDGKLEDFFLLTLLPFLEFPLWEFIFYRLGCPQTPLSSPSWLDSGVCGLDSQYRVHTPYVAVLNR